MDELAILNDLDIPLGLNAKPGRLSSVPSAGKGVVYVGVNPKVSNSVKNQPVGRIKQEGGVANARRRSFTDGSGSGSFSQSDRRRSTFG
jgi:hypothetical protein